MRTATQAQLRFDPEDTGLSGETQRIREMSEAWAARSLWCPACTGRLDQAPAGRASLDLLCSTCALEFELKAKRVSRRGVEVRSLSGGAYGATLRRFEGTGGPNLILLEYEASTYEVVRATLFPSFYLVPSVVDPRTPLRSTARRAGWQGCNIRLHRIPAAGRLTWIDRGVLAEPGDLGARWQGLQTLQRSTPSPSRGWMVDVLRVVESLPTHFALTDVYRAESELAALHPDNNNIRAKVRQQLQRLRDAGWIVFQRPGYYEKVGSLEHREAYSPNSVSTGN